MPTEVTIDGERFLINGRATYAGRTHEGRTIEGLLFNTRMVQAIFDDENPQTVDQWTYPDTGRWDPDRNTDEFCAMLPIYAAHGVLGVTVSLQGGGSNYRKDIYERYQNDGFTPDGTIKPAYAERLRRVLVAADAAGVIVIMSYFYWRQIGRLRDRNRIFTAIESATDWLLRSGHRNIIVDLANETGAWFGHPCLEPSGIQHAIEAAKSVRVDGRRLLVSSSTLGSRDPITAAWHASGDFAMPHGNDLGAEQLRAKLRALRAMPAFRAHPKPILINEDSIHLDNLEAATDEYASWGFYCQGNGSSYKDPRHDWTAPRETRFAELSGYQTMPVNWGINTPDKRAFFQRVREITGVGDSD